MNLLKKKTGKMLSLLLPSILFITILILWVLISAFELVPNYFLPSPKSIMVGFHNLVRDNHYLSDVGVSIYRVAIAFLLSAVIGVPLGVLSGINANVDRTISPLIDFVRHMPVAGFIPLTILWIGINDIQKVSILFIGTFFQLVPMVINATKRIPEEFIDTARTLGAQEEYIILKIVVPWALPGIYDSLRISLGITWTYLIVAEIVAASVGIGHVIIQAQRYLQTDYIFVGIITVGLLGLLTDTFLKRLYVRLFPWVLENNI